MTELGVKSRPEMKRPVNIISNWMNISSLSMYYCTSFLTITLTQRAIFNIMGMVLPSYWSDDYNHSTHDTCFWSEGNYYVHRFLEYNTLLIKRTIKW